MSAAVEAAFAAGAVVVVPRLAGGREVEEVVLRWMWCLEQGERRHARPGLEEAWAAWAEG